MTTSFYGLSIYACLLLVFFIFLQPWLRFFSQPLIGEPSNSNFNKWYVSWLLVATMNQLVGAYVRMNLSLFLKTFAFSILFLFIYYLSVSIGLRYILYRVGLKWPEIWAILQVCALATSGSHGVSPEEIFPNYAIWATLIICLYIVHYAAERSPAGSYKKKKKKQTKPDFLDMVPWYPGASADLYKTVFDLLLSVTVFLGRFDMRILQATMNPTNKKKARTQQGDLLYDHFIEKKELWFDFMADTGDGGNSTYSVARLLAQPSIQNLPRGDLLLIGGDIAYPNPSEFTYKKRLFRPFQYALQPPRYRQDDNPNVPAGLSDGPRCFIIPGNHDWIDGLHTFMRNICHKRWLGGWFMPQRRSYFALKLPQRWWIFGLDLALHGDIDVYQFDFFSKLARKTVGKKDSVIIMTHQPDWLLDWYENKDSSSSSRNNVSDLICRILKERCKLRIAGDIHHYMRHSIVKPDESVSSKQKTEDEPDDKSVSSEQEKEDEPDDESVFSEQERMDEPDNESLFSEQERMDEPDNESLFSEQERIDEPDNESLFSEQERMDEPDDESIVESGFFKQERMNIESCFPYIQSDCESDDEPISSEQERMNIESVFPDILSLYPKQQRMIDSDFSEQEIMGELDDEPISSEQEKEDEPVFSEQERKDAPEPVFSEQERKDAPEPVYAQHLLVNGCGGAFMHPTHVFHNFGQSHGVSYKLEKAYPSFKQSRRLALRNIWNFRKENWQFDFIGGIIYFVLVFSMFPQCKLDHIFQAADSISGFWRSFFGTVWNAFMYMLQSSCVSLGGAMLFLSVAILFVPSKMPWKTRAMIGILHVSAHLAAALILMLVLELGVETFVRHNLLATSGYHSLYRWYQSMESRDFPDSSGIRAWMEQWTFGLYPACIKYLMSAFNVPELMAVTRTSICKNGMENLSRGGSIIYYASVFLYFWVLSTPIVSFVFGSYLYICVNWFYLHYDEAFSSLKIADYKAFTRFHIKPNGDLEVYTLAVDKVPQEWKLDPKWKEEGKQLDPEQLSHHRTFPSKWRAAAEDQDPVDTVKIIDQFTIRKTPR